MIRHSWVQIVQEVSEERVFKSFIARIIIIWNLKKSVQITNLTVKSPNISNNS
jgi:hypothetical protein